MKHGKYVETTNFVNAYIDRNSMTYHIKFDLGDPEVIKPYEDNYELYIFVADPLLE